MLKVRHVGDCRQNDAHLHFFSLIQPNLKRESVIFMTWASQGKYTAALDLSDHCL